jgi:hypothetical protein
VTEAGWEQRCAELRTEVDAWLASSSTDSPFVDLVRSVRPRSVKRALAWAKVCGLAAVRARGQVFARRDEYKAAVQLWKDMEASAGVELDGSWSGGVPSGAQMLDVLK